MRNDCRARHPDRTGVLLHAFGQAQAHATNEQSRHAPKTLDQYKATHGPGCGCCSTGKKKPARLMTKSKSGAKGFPTAAPLDDQPLTVSQSSIMALASVCGGASASLDMAGQTWRGAGASP